MGLQSLVDGEDGRKRFFLLFPHSFRAKPADPFPAECFSDPTDVLGGAVLGHAAAFALHDGLVRVVRVDGRTVWIAVERVFVIGLLNVCGEDSSQPLTLLLSSE